ncbi:MAG: polysaccharide deacetylase family protein [Candidatus Levybacteria bacterium]|nr:polysaccharide deacetylase family protein [Candidatus Levybacteria bacterium]
MPKRQTKVIYGIIVLVLFSLIGLELFKTPFVMANQLLADNQTPVVFASSILASPTPYAELPLAANVEQSLAEIITSQSASEEANLNKDYCIDVPVVTYHHIQPLEMAEKLGHKVLTVDNQMFENQIKYLSENGYTALDAHDLVYALQTQTPLPEKSIIITIDDGYDDNYTYAFMVAKKYQFIMNFMIPTGLIGKSGYMQWEHLQELKESPYATIYNHTNSHAPLGYITKDNIINEVTTANEQLALHLGLENKIVTYPYGAYDDEAVQTLQELDISAAFSTDNGRTHCLSNIMKLPRMRIGNAPMNFYGF